MQIVSCKLISKGGAQELEVQPRKSVSDSAPTFTLSKSERPIATHSNTSHGDRQHTKFCSVRFCSSNLPACGFQNFKLLIQRSWEIASDALFGSWLNIWSKPQLSDISNNYTLLHTVFDLRHGQEIFHAGTPAVWFRMYTTLADLIVQLLQFLSLVM